MMAIITVDKLHIFDEMQESGLSPDEYTYSSILSVIANLGNLQEGKKIHMQLKVGIIINRFNIYIL